MTAQASLFDAPIVDPTPVAAVRHSDPATSHQAARANRAGRQSQRMRLLRAYLLAADDPGPRVRGFGGVLTDEQAGHLAGINRVADTRRASELRQHGWIAPTGETRLTVTNSPAMLCGITDAGREVLVSNSEGGGSPPESDDK